MRKLFSILMFTSIAAVSAYSETIQGNMVVGAYDELPQGLFAKAQGYLPGDIISITNSSTGEVVQLLNLGTLDGSDNVAIVISRESARLLNMSEGEVSAVTLDTRSGSFDQRAKGGASISKPASSVSRTEIKEPEPYAEPEPAAETAPENPMEQFTDDGPEDDFEATRKAVETPSPADEVPEEINYEAVDDELPPDEIKEEPAPVREEAPAPAEEPEVKAEPEPEGPDYEAFTPDELSEIQDEPAPVQETEPEEPQAEPEEVPPEQSADSGEAFVPDSLDAVEEEPAPVPAENDAVEADLEGEDVKSVEPAKPAEEYSGELFTDELPADEPAPVPEALPAEDEEPSEDEPVADFNALPAENYGQPDPDLSDEEVASVEPEREVEKDLEGERVDNADPSVEAPVEETPAAEEVPAVETEPEAPVSDELTGQPDPDLPGEEVVSVEPERVPEEDLLGEKVASVEPEKEPEADLAGEKVENAPPVPDEEAYEGIVLVPAEPLPPEASEKPVPEPEPEPEAPAPEEEKPAEKPAVDMERLKVPEGDKRYTVILESDSDFTVIDESSLVKGKYYIQIAVYSKKENASETIGKYARYPIVVTQNDKGMYRLLVGPLTEDEYGAVFQRFKSFGFKDAFVKKIK